MHKLLVRTYAAAEDCESHLKATGAAGTEIESYLTQYLLVVLCADIQQEIYRLSEERTAAATDNCLSSFVAASARKILRSIGKADIAKYIEMFGAECKQKLNSQLTDEDVTIYNNAVCGRHEVAHNPGRADFLAEFEDADGCKAKQDHPAAPPRYSLGLGPPATTANPN